MLPLLPRASLASLLGTIGPAQDQAAATAHSPTTAFVDVSVIPMDRDRVLTRQMVVVQGGRILALGPARAVRVPVGATQIDGRGKFLIPGLADMHVHVLSGLFDAIPMGLFDYIGNGITTIRDMHSGGRGPRPGMEAPSSKAFGLALKRRLARGEILGPRSTPSAIPT